MTRLRNTTAGFALGVVLVMGALAGSTSSATAASQRSPLPGLLPTSTHGGFAFQPPMASIDNSYAIFSATVSSFIVPPTGTVTFDSVNLDRSTPDIIVSGTLSNCSWSILGPSRCSVTFGIHEASLGCGTWSVSANYSGDFLLFRPSSDTNYATFSAYSCGG
jgi:hypothetical protein